MYGTILQSLLPGDASSVPNGTVIKRLRPRSVTPIYSYTVDSTNAPTVISSGSQNTGSVPFSQHPIYISYTSKDVDFDQ